MNENEQPKTKLSNKTRFEADLFHIMETSGEAGLEMLEFLQDEGVMPLNPQLDD